MPMTKQLIVLTLILVTISNTFADYHQIEVCNNDIGYSWPGYSVWQWCEHDDCCCCTQEEHVHDMGEVLTGPMNLLIQIKPGWQNGCTSTYGIYKSEDNSSWSLLDHVTLTTHSAPGGGWRTYNHTVENVTNFRFIKVKDDWQTTGHGAPCFVDYSAIYSEMADQDNDGIPDDEDNCPTIYNPGPVSYTHLTLPTKA